MKPDKHSKKLTQAEFERFLSNVSKPDLIEQCWEWEGTRTTDNYGQFSLRGRVLRAHRVSYTLFNGTIEPGMLVRHRCDNPLCVNPKHLVLGTNADNMQDLSEKLYAKQFNGMSRLDFEMVEALMPRSNKIEAFGPEFEQLLLRAYNEIFVNKKEEWAVQFPNPKISNRIRMRMYTYFRVISQKGGRPDLAFQCKYLSMRLAGNALVFYHINEDVESRALREALGLQKGFADTGGTDGILAPQSAHTDALARLKRIRATKK